MKNSVLITGAAGGIGAALCEAFSDANWHVIATSRERPKPARIYDVFIEADLDALAGDDALRAEFANKVRRSCADYPLKTLINNAALQHLGATENISAQDLTQSFNVNVIAPFLLVQAFLPELKAEKGSVLNIGTVHAQATKPGFVAYASSKTALHGLTRALAVDLGPHIRVNTLAPAATATPMLLAGFDGRDEAYQQLSDIHPAGRIAQPSEIGKAALFLSSNDAAFITGSTLYIDGGILSRLHDPL